MSTWPMYKPSKLPSHFIGVMATGARSLPDEVGSSAPYTVGDE
jgi:hypothetical protein